MNILVTGAKGFVGKNLIVTLQNIKDGKDCRSKNLCNIDKIFCYDIDSTEEELCQYAQDCDFVFHLAGINRPQNVQEFMEGNFGFTTTLLELLKKYNNKAPILMSSSIQSTLDNDYGRSKKAGEDYLIEYGKTNGVKRYIFRLPNVFGKWCRPNYNSAIATFCNNIAHDLPIQVNNRDTVMTLVYIDDVVNAFIDCINGKCNCVDGYCNVGIEHTATLGEIVDTITSFKESRDNYFLPNVERGGLATKLYSTYLSYLPTDDFSYKLVSHNDARGSFTEFVKTLEYGQVSVNISKSGIVKGNHWHHSKNEKFLVVKGQGVIRFRKVGESEIIEYKVCSDKLEVIDIPCGYTHNIENIGEEDMVTIMWANEVFDPNNPDTYYLEV